MTTASPYRMKSSWSSHVYQGMHHEYSGFGSGYFDSMIPESDSYGFSGKELERFRGLNIYDFEARTYVPDEARFWQPDPMAGDYHWLSPYSYCAGDPINFIDPTGRECRSFHVDSTMQRFAKNYPDDNSINIVSHGNYQSLVYLIDPNSDKEYIRTSEDLINAINKHFKTALGNVLGLECAEVKLFACMNGHDNEKTGVSPAQNFSERFPNGIIYAVDDKVVIDGNGTYKAASKEFVWRIFHQGKEISSRDVNKVRRKLRNKKIVSAFLNTTIQKLNKATITPIIFK